MLSIDSSWRRVAAPIAICAAALALVAFPAGATAAVYPPGGSVFAADAEGWQATEATCNIPFAGLCSASGGHDSGAGNPAGSLAAEADIALNLGGLFKSTVVLESPDFTAAEGGFALLQLDRQFESAGLIALAPKATYSVNLTDRGTETTTQILTETLDEGDGSFAGEDAVTALAAGHTYALSIETDIGATTASIGMLGAAIAHFDNLTLSTDEGGGDDGGDGGANPGSGGGEAAGGGAGGESTTSTTLTTSELRTLVRRGDTASAQMRGTHVFVKLRCPMRAERACRITAQGRIRKRLPVTQRRTVTVAKGRGRLVGLRVKRRFMAKVATRKRLLVVQKVRAGDVTTTFARSRALIRQR